MGDVLGSRWPRFFGFYNYLGLKVGRSKLGDHSAWKSIDLGFLAKGRYDALVAMSLSWLDCLLMLVYFAFVLGVGVSLKTQQTTSGAMKAIWEAGLRESSGAVR
jgi:hypothetical protein